MHDSGTDKPEGSATPAADRAGAPAELGDFYLSSSEFAQAEEEFTTRLAAASGAERAALMRKIGLCRERRGERDLALAALEAAEAEARGAGDPIEATRASLHIGKVLFLAGNLDGARHRAEAAREILRSSGDIPYRGMAESLLGGIAYRRGDLDLARRHFEKSVLLGKEGQDLTLLARGYNNLGLIQKELCDWDQAVDSFRASLGLDSTAANYDSRSSAWINLGIVHLKRSEWKEAADMFRRAHKTAVEVGNRLGQVRSLLGLAGVHRGERAWGELERTLDEAAGLAARHPYPREVALVHLARAWGALDRGDHAAARQELAEAGPLIGHLAPEGELAAHAARLGAHVALAHGEAESALAEAERATGLARTCGDRYELATMARVEGMALARLGRAGEAEDAFDRGVRALRRMGERHELGLTLLAWGEFAPREAAAGAPATALAGPTALDRLLEASSLLAAVPDPAAVTRACVAIAHHHHRHGRAAEALDALRAGWSRLAELEQPDGLRDDLLALQRAIEGDLVRRATPERNRVMALLGLVAQVPQTAGAARGAVLPRFLEQLAELFEADGAALACAEAGAAANADSAWRGEAVTGLRPQEKRAVLAFLDAHGPTLAAMPVFYTADARGAPLLAGTALAAVRPVGSAILVVVSDPHGRLWALYLDRVREGTGAFGGGEIELLAALRQRLPAVLSAVQAPARPREGEGEGACQAGLRYDGFVGSHPKIRDILAKIACIRGSSIRILLQGETGTGKGKIARIIHQNSVRSERSFRVLNCAALPETLLESELFGHVKGSFTGATGDKIGLLEEANGGTVFLDDIEKTGTSVQRGLLHFLDCGEVRPVGSTRPRRLDVRVICATSSPELWENVRAGTFSKDLFFRLQHFTITVPPLRERPEDILPLARHLLACFAGEYGGGPHDLDPTVARRLTEYVWPGNVRELENAMRHAVALGRGAETVTLALLPESLRTAEPAREPCSQRLSDLVQSFEAERVRAGLKQFDAVTA